MNPEHMSTLFFIAESILFKTTYDAGEIALTFKKLQVARIVKFLKLTVVIHCML